jgi:hypothetical protein
VSSVDAPKAVVEKDMERSEGAVPEVKPVKG